MRGALKAAGVHRAVEKLRDGSLTVDELSSDEQESHDQLWGYLVQRLSGRALEVARGAGDSLHECVAALDSLFNAQNASQRMLSMKSLVTSKMDESGDLIRFIGEKESQVKERLQGCISPEEVLLLSVVTNLPKRFAETVSTILTTEGITFAQAKAKLVEFENTYKTGHAETDKAVLHVTQKELDAKISQAVLNFTRGLNDRKGGGGKGGGKPLLTAKKTGEKDKGNKGDGKARRKCYACGGLGHEKKDCPNRKNKQAGGG